TFAGNGLYRYSANGVSAANTFLSNPQDLKIGPDGLLYIVDSQNQRIVRINSDGTVVTVAGNGSYGNAGDGKAATSASLYYPRQIAFDKPGNMYIADSLNCRIRKVNTQGIISIFAGSTTPGAECGYYGDGGLATAAGLLTVTGVAVDSTGSLYIS